MSGDHPYSDPGDGRTECETCGKYIWPATHSCKRVPVTEAAMRRYEERRYAVMTEEHPTGAMGFTCVVHQHDSWVPIEVHHVWPLGLHGPDIASNRVPLCANGHGQVHAYLSLLIKGKGRIPWIVARRYGSKVRALALRGFLESRPR